MDTNTPAIAEPMETLLLKPGTIVQVSGWPVELTSETEVRASKANIELVTRDQYLRTPGGMAPE